jgi:uncharacterized membrane protein YkoI
MRKRTIAVLSGTAALALAGAAYATAGGQQASAGSRLDDGKDLLPQASITESQAVAAARTAASGDLNEVDLERAGGTLVFNVDVGARDVKVDAATGRVVAVDEDD